MIEQEAQIDDIVLNYLVTSVREGLARGEIDSPLSDVAIAQLILDVMSVTNHQWLSQSPSISLADRLNERFDVLLMGLAPRPERGK